MDDDELEQHLQVCQDCGPPLLTLEKLSSLTETYRDFPHELPILLILENTSQALRNMTVEEMSNHLDDWVYETEAMELLKEEMEEEENQTEATEASSHAWWNTRVMDLDVSRRPTNVSLDDLRSVRDVFVTLALVESQPSPRKATGLSSVASMIPLLEPLSSSSNPSLFQMLPWMEALRSSQGLDWVHASAKEKVIYNALEQKLERWEQQHPVIQRYL